VYDNGTTICDKGHKLHNPGTCVSQSIGTVNSTDDTFQPAYSICTSDFLAFSNTYTKIINKIFNVNGSLSVIATYSFNTDVFLYLQPEGVNGLEWVAVKSLSLSPSVVSLVSLSNTINSSSIFELVPDYITGSFKFLQLDSGYILKGDNVTAEDFVYDIYSAITILSPYYYVPKIIDITKVISSGDVDSSLYELIEPRKGSISNPSLDEYGAPNDNPASICVGDLVKPALDNVSPSQESHLNSFDSSVSFDIIDAIGGVDLSSLYITVSGNITSQPEDYEVVSAGVEQTVNAVIDGTENRYTFTYSPTNEWMHNEIVSVTITGTDNVPISSQTGAEFSCYSGDPNPFFYSWDFYVNAYEDMPASITAIADTGAPYLENISPLPYYGDRADVSNISFDIKDDLAGVDKNSIFVYINDIAVVSNGVVAGSNITLTGDPSKYTFTYVNTGGFNYNSRVYVRVVASDLYVISPNELDTTYYFDIIDDGLVQFENFYPEVGITWNPEYIDISVDVVDRVYDIDVSDLYLNINGTTVPASVSSISGTLPVITSVSGVVDTENAIIPVEGLSYSGTCIYEADFVSVSTDGAYVWTEPPYAGTVQSGVAYGGCLYNLPQEYLNHELADLYSAYTLSGTVVTGTLNTVLVSGVNWDGKNQNSTITDVDVCDFYANSVAASGVTITGTIGRNLMYHPLNDFNYVGDIDVVVHASNLNYVSTVQREYSVVLSHGYNYKVFDNNFEHNSKVNVYIEAFNIKDFVDSVNENYYFETIEQQSSDITSYIQGIAPWEELGASIEPRAPVHKYGKTMEVEVYVEDKNGNALGPYTYSYTIESAPDE